MTFGTRLKHYIENYYISVDQFCKDMDFDRTALSRYFNDRSRPAFEKLNSFYNIGVSIDWLLTGKGEIFNDEIIQLVESNNNIKLDFPSISKSIISLKKWITENYGSLIALCDEFEYDYEFMFTVLEGKKVPSPKFIRKIERAGCNTVWFYTGKGTSYANNPMGFILENKMKTEGAIKVNDNKDIESIENIHKIINIAIKNDMNGKKMFDY